MYTITKVTQILEQMEKCGFAISNGKLEQVSLYNKSDMTYKFIGQFELPDPVDQDKLDKDPQMQRIGHNKSYDSDESEENDDDEDGEENKTEK